MNYLRQCQQLVQELNQENGSVWKQKVLKQQDSNTTRKLLSYVYSPFKQFYVTSSNIKKNGEKLKAVNNHSNIFALLDDLSARKITGNEAISNCLGFVRAFSEYEDTIYKIIDKNLEIRCNASLINKALPGCVPTFSLALAKKYDDYESKINFVASNWAMSRKLDGVRCIARKENDGSVTLWSRQGKQFETLAAVEEAVSRLPIKSGVFDGEICLVKNGLEDFQGIMKEIRRKDHQIEDAIYYVFDYLTLEEFDAEKGAVPFEERMLKLADVVQDSPLPGTVRVLTQLKVESKEHLNTMLEQGVKDGWEGLILRNMDSGYEGKRTSNLLKVKAMQDAEYVVKGHQTGPFRIVKAGKEETITTLTAIEIEHKGNKVSVGSGFSLAQREEFYKNPEKILDKTVTIQYFEETQNQKGEYSLRFPVFKCIHGKKRSV
jgi:DNA ligase-1